MHHILNLSKNSLEILTEESARHRIDAGTLKETVLESDIESLTDLNRALNTIDPKGSEFALTES